jgi:hypothetical protein
MSSGSSMKFCLFVELDIVPDPGDVADVVEGIAHQLRQLQQQRPGWNDMRDLSPFQTKEGKYAAIHGVLEHDGQKAAWFSVAEIETHGAPELEDALDSDVRFYAEGLYGEQKEGPGPLEDTNDRPN